MIEVPKGLSLEPSRRVICIVCGCQAEMRFSKKKKPYIFCAHCITRYFLNSNMAFAGYFLTTELLLPVLPEHKVLLEERVSELIHGINSSFQQQFGRPRKK